MLFEGFLRDIANLRLYIASLGKLLASEQVAMREEVGRIVSDIERGASRG